MDPGLRWGDGGCLSGMTLFWQERDFWDSQGAKSLIHRVPAFVEAVDHSSDQSP
jgi:hypothetical protein